MEIINSKLKLVGYAYLIERFALAGTPPWHTSYVSNRATLKEILQEGVAETHYPNQYWPGDGVGDHLEFALKYDGVNLGLLSLIFQHLAVSELIAYVESKPTGRYARRIWFFYEFLTGEFLPIKDVTSGNYVDALEKKKYFVLANGENSKRHRVVNNLLGPRAFCPIVRKTTKLSQTKSEDLLKKCSALLEGYPPELLKRAVSYLYQKETKSSFAIEHEKPNAQRAERFVASLVLAGKEDFCKKSKLINLQNRIVDPRFRVPDYRLSQNYVGQTLGYLKEVIHFISPKPDDLPDLMSGLLECHKRMMDGSVPPVVHAAIVAYGFVYLHPFEDGNGRIHRFLIHNILSLRKLVPAGFIFPVSAAMHKNSAEYDASLEAFSKPLMELIEYNLDVEGGMVVKNETALWYRTIDLTTQAEALITFVTKTIEEDLVEELNFLASYDATKKAIQSIIDMPDRKIDLFIQCCQQNQGRLSPKKRAGHFDFLTDEELGGMEVAVRAGFDRYPS